MGKLLVKLFEKSFRERRLYEKWLSSFFEEKEAKRLSSARNLLPEGEWLFPRRTTIGRYYHGTDYIDADF
ncbi:hypothetical protein [Gluconacetobacter entanii]|uniref:hypothetical protein n=1 Tax=Gluconacetobacter entanii TaxID=108528 RepID=UPI00142D281D|nr:hypothetical protein [Gluconacetobacter entanii]